MRLTLRNFWLIGLIWLIPIQLMASTTGKISGKVYESQSGDPLPGVNVLIQGTSMGAATNIDGEFSIINVPPGSYTVKASMIGYQTYILEGLSVSVNLTTQVDLPLSEAVLEGEEVVVKAEKKLVQKDITSSRSLVDAGQIEAMPVENVGEVIELQAGMVNGHLRGGRANEVAYMIDGIAVTDPYSGSLPIEVENAAVQELQVISGVFNAEYGQAQSGVVNIVTREGSADYDASISLASGDYYSTDTERYLDGDSFDADGLMDVQVDVSGPTPFLNKLTFFATGRFVDENGYLYGERRFMPTDHSIFSPPDDPDQWIIEETGDGALVPMNPFKRWSGQLKLAYPLTASLKLTYGFIGDDTEYQEYDGFTAFDESGASTLFKYNPEGLLHRYKTSSNHILTLNHVLGQNTFHTFKISLMNFDYEHYVYEDPLDPRYPPNERLQDASNNAFYTGGVQMEHFYRSTRNNTYRYDLTSQISQRQQIKIGAEANLYELTLHEFRIRVDEETDWKPYINPITSPDHNRYKHQPLSFAVYAQDKLEFNDIIVNVGLRFDGFDPDAKVITDHAYPQESATDDASLKTKLSPRLGIAYPITETGVLRFSYGHFFQIPPFELLYHNPEREVEFGRLASTMGNADLEPEQTITYEFGLQQELVQGLKLDAAVYYKDIRNLVGTRIYETFNVRKYAQYVNRDYGNVRGFTISLTQTTSLYGASLDYTYQIAEGNASDPNAVFLDNQTDPPQESEKQTVALDWDQRHTLNLSIFVGPSGNWNLGLIGKIGSGLPYTPAYQNQRTSFENSERRPATFAFDLRFDKWFKLGSVNCSFFAKVFNLFDRRNEEDVYADTGRATYTLQQQYAGNVQGVNTLDDFFNRPDYYDAPRRIKVGLRVNF